MDLMYNMVTYQQWSSCDSSRAGGGGSYRVDQITALNDQMDAVQKAIDKMAMQRAFNNYQPQQCVMCGDRRHSYEYCPYADWDEEPEQFNNPWSNNNHTFQSDPPEPYIDPAESDFMHEQGKTNQMMWEQLQSMSTQLTAQGKLLEQLSHLVASSQPQASELPSQTEVNPRGTQYEGPALPDHADHAVKTDDLEEPGRDLHESHASRVPHDLEIKGSQSDEPNATSVKPDATRVEPDATSVKTQTEGPTPKLMPLPPTPELKSLPANLRYEFLDPEKSCLLIISADLEPDRTATLFEKLKAHKGAIGFSIKGSKEILRIHLMQEFDRMVRVLLKWVLPPVPPDPSPTQA